MQIAEFSDESFYSIPQQWSNHGVEMTWVAACNVIEVGGFGGGFVMLWAGIYLGSCMDLYILQTGYITTLRYYDEVLELIVEPFAGLFSSRIMLLIIIS